MRLPQGATGAEGEVTLGVRPQHLTLQEAVEPAVSVPADLEVVEPLGSENFFFCRLADGDEQVTLRTDASTRRDIGDRLSLCLDPKHVHVFSATGEALAHATATTE